MLSSGQIAEAVQRRGARALASPGVREHLLLSAAFALTRLGLGALGLRFNFALDWMFLSDPADLRERLLETLVYFHAYPPGMNLLTGWLLKLGGAHAAGLAQACFCAFGLLLANSLLFLLRRVGLPSWCRLGLCLAFSVTPATLYFESLYLYECPVAALVCLAAALFYRAVLLPRASRWLAFFAVCCAIGMLRSTFHLVWLGALALASLWLAPAAARRQVLLGAAAPTLLLLALYLKNLALFGVFGAASSASSTLAHMTVLRLTPEERRQWIEAGKLSPFAGISVYAPPRAYLPYFPGSNRPAWPGQLQALERPTLGAPNFNHWFFLEVGPRRAADSRYYLEQRPLAYAGTVLRSFAQFFGASTDWHPSRQHPIASPHEQHRRVLGGYEAAYNRLFHGVGSIYLLLPPCLIWALLRARRLLRSSEREAPAQAALLCFGLFQIAYVVLLSSVFTIGESSRYRYQIEALIWVIGATALLPLAGRLRRWLLAFVRPPVAGALQPQLIARRSP
jgi:hypothetical protein